MDVVLRGTVISKAGNEETDPTGFSQQSGLSAVGSGIRSNLCSLPQQTHPRSLAVSPASTHTEGLLYWQHIQ